MQVNHCVESNLYSESRSVCCQKNVAHLDLHSTSHIPRLLPFPWGINIHFNFRFMWCTFCSLRHWQLLHSSCRWRVVFLILSIRSGICIISGVLLMLFSWKAHSIVIIIQGWRCKFFCLTRLRDIFQVYNTAISAPAFIHI